MDDRSASDKSTVVRLSLQLICLGAGKVDRCGRFVTMSATGCRDGEFATDKPFPVAFAQSSLRD
jgi:hypothetical protein